MSPLEYKDALIEFNKKLKDNINIFINNVTFYDHDYTTAPSNFIEDCIRKTSTLCYITSYEIPSSKLLSQFRAMTYRIDVALDNDIYEMYVTPEEILTNSFFNSYCGSYPITMAESAYKFNGGKDGDRIDNKWYVIYSKNSEGSVSAATPLACMTQEMKYVTNKFINFHYDLFTECQIIPKLKYYLLVNNENYSIM